MRTSRPRVEQPNSEEIRDRLLDFIRTKFYQGQFVQFAKDRRHLLKWVVFKLAVYLTTRGVSLPAARYIEIMLIKPGILMEALRFGDTGNIGYLPAWLGACVERHLNVHGEDYYDEGKLIRNHVDSIAAKFAHVGAQRRDPVREMAEAARLLKTPKKTTSKPAKTNQLTFL